MEKWKEHQDTLLDKLLSLSELLVSAREINTMMFWVQNEGKKMKNPVPFPPSFQSSRKVVFSLFIFFLSPRINFFFVQRAQDLHVPHSQTQEYTPSIYSFINTIFSFIQKCCQKKCQVLAKELHTKTNQTSSLLLSWSEVNGGQTVALYPQQETDGVLRLR